MNKYKQKIKDMMLDILAEGEAEIWQDIEGINNAFERLQTRQIYYEALKRII